MPSFVEVLASRVSVSNGSFVLSCLVWLLLFLRSVLKMPLANVENK